MEKKDKVFLLFVQITPVAIIIYIEVTLGIFKLVGSEQQTFNKSNASEVMVRGSQDNVLKGIGASPCYLGSLVLGAASCHEVRKLKQICGGSPCGKEPGRN